MVHMLCKLAFRLKLHFLRSEKFFNAYLFHHFFADQGDRLCGAGTDTPIAHRTVSFLMRDLPVHKKIFPRTPCRALPAAHAFFRIDLKRVFIFLCRIPKIQPLSEQSEQVGKSSKSLPRHFSLFDPLRRPPHLFSCRRDDLSVFFLGFDQRLYVRDRIRHPDMYASCDHRAVFFQQTCRHTWFRLRKINPWSP